MRVRYRDARRRRQTREVHPDVSAFAAAAAAAARVPFAASSSSLASFIASRSSSSTAARTSVLVASTATFNPIPIPIPRARLAVPRDEKGSTSEERGGALERARRRLCRVSRLELHRGASRYVVFPLARVEDSDASNRPVRSKHARRRLLRDVRGKSVDDEAPTEIRIDAHGRRRSRGRRVKMNRRGMGTVGGGGSRGSDDERAGRAGATDGFAKRGDGGRDGVRGRVRGRVHERETARDVGVAAARGRDVDARGGEVRREESGDEVAVAVVPEEAHVEPGGVMRNRSGRVCARVRGGRGGTRQRRRVGGGGLGLLRGGGVLVLRRDRRPARV